MNNEVVKIDKPYNIGCNICGQRKDDLKDFYIKHYRPKGTNSYCTVLSMCNECALKVAQGIMEAENYDK